MYRMNFGFRPRYIMPSDSDEEGLDLSDNDGDPVERERNERLQALLSGDKPLIVSADAIVNEDDIDVAELEAMKKGLCSECGDQPATLFCEQCGDDFCKLCSEEVVHKKGNRKRHTTTPVQLPEAFRAAASGASSASSAAAAGDDSGASPMMVDEGADDDSAPSAGSSSSAAAAAAAAAASSSSSSALAAGPMVPPTDATKPAGPSVHVLPKIGEPVGEWFVNRARYIPVRLTLPDRKRMRLVAAALDVSEYTDKVDIISYKKKAGRIHKQLKEICGILTGMQTAANYKKGKALLEDADFKDHANFFQHMFEVARRHKVRNPEKLRTSYGKMLHLLMDSQIPEIRELLEFELVQPLQTSYALLEQKGGLDVLRDPRVTIVVSEIRTAGKTRREIDAEARAKDRALEELKREYSNPATGLTEDDIHVAIRSIGDNFNQLRFNMEPVEEMLGYLRKYFNPDQHEPGFSLAIAYGRSGSRLTHSHKAQYKYVEQSLMLWREIQFHIFELWMRCEADLLDPENRYRLRDTGQGLNRVQSAPRVGKAMFNIVRRIQRQVGSWVGSSVIHLGDHAVPNAFTFLDKYSQVPRILTPIVTTLREIDEMAKKPSLQLYMQQTFGGAEKAKQNLCLSFFRHAFDGSGGGDNATGFEAGSCIDGRLTSAWEWCQALNKKHPHLYDLMVLANKTLSFDGAGGW